MSGNFLDKYKGFKAELALAESFNEIKILESKASATAEFARKNKIGKTEQDEWGVFRCDIEAKKGAWLDEYHPPKVNASSSMADAGVGFHESANSRVITKEPELVKEAVDELKQNNNKVVTPAAVVSIIRKRLRKEKIEKQAEELNKKVLTEPKGLFDVIVIDPPWEYSEKGGFSYKQYDSLGNRGGVDYNTMNLEQIKNIELPIEEDCVLFLWTTHKFLPDSFDLLNEWGFEYKATLVWDKEKMGIGRTIRLQCEFCLIGIMGKPVIIGSSERDIIREKRRQHSRKPDAFYDMVQRMCPGRKLDYFGRQNREGWDVYGAESGRF